MATQHATEHCHLPLNSGGEVEWPHCTQQKLFNNGQKGQPLASFIQRHSRSLSLIHISEPTRLDVI
eukprot:9503749-Prorocentrum_lima.AAC.1